MEYSKLGLEHFTPDYTRYFHALPEPVRDRLVPAQWQLHKGIDADTIAAIHDELYRRTLARRLARRRPHPRRHTSAPPAASPPPRSNSTSNTPNRAPAPASPPTPSSSPPATANAPSTASSPASTPTCAATAAERPRIDDSYRLVLDPSVTGAVYVQNAERHTHGVGAPDLGLAAWRSATILNTLTGKDALPPARAAPPSPPSASTDHAPAPARPPPSAPVASALADHAHCADTAPARTPPHSPAELETPHPRSRLEHRRTLPRQLPVHRRELRRIHRPLRLSPTR